MAYITLSDIPELGKVITKEDEDNVTQICDQASSLVDAYCQRISNGSFSFDLQSFKENLIARVSNGKVSLFPKYYNVVEVNSVIIEGTPAKNFAIDEGNQRILAEVDGVRTGEYFCMVEYTAGFTTIPTSIKKATVLIARSLLDEYSLTQMVGISGLTAMKQGSITLQRSPKTLNQDIPIKAQLLLAEYRRVR